LVLVGVTIYHAVQAKKMAEEMRDAKFEALRPLVWIIQPRPHWPEGQDLPQHITIQLETKGLGPALNILLKFIHPDGPFSEQYISFMAVGMNGSWALKSLGASDARLAESSFIQAIYEDVYGRKFESKLEGELDEKERDFRIVRFTTRRLSQGESPNDS
ncbi:MAG: hypothetical protein ACE5JL_09425, partial [Dehalococcoidia bacterium]